MNPKITILLEGKDVDEAAAQSALESVPEFKVNKVGQERGVIEATGKLVAWVAEFSGNVGKIVDALLKVAENQLAGSKIKIKYGDKEIEVSGVKRSQLMETLEQVQSMAQSAANL